MNCNRTATENQLPLTELKRIDAICVLFETAWKAGRNPRIENHLGNAREPERSHLFAELLRLEAELLSSQGSTCNVREYHQRFPEFSQVIDVVFRGSQSDLSVQPHLAGNTEQARSGHGKVSPTVRVSKVNKVAPGPPGPGRVGPFELIRLLGRGGMGEVYLARQAELQRMVAIKLILEAQADRPISLARFRAEAKAVARLQHPNIVQIFELGQSGGRPFLVLEYIEGHSLADRLGGKAQRPREAAGLIQTVAHAVEVAHQKGIIHRDLKPANILLAGSRKQTLRQCIPKVADFGLAMDLTSKSNGDADLTSTGSLVGSPGYMTPEQVRGQKPGPPTDVFALGIILYEMLTGRLPFQGSTILETFELIREQEPARPRRLRPDCPADLETICLKCLEKDPQRRYVSSQALADDLGRYLEGKPVVARPAGLLGRIARWAGRNPLISGLLLAVVLTSLIGAGTASFFALEATARARRAEVEKERADRAALAEANVRLDSDWRLYACQVCLSQREIERGMTTKARMVLNSTRTDFRGWEFAYLQTGKLASPNLARAFSPAVHALAFVPDGQLLLADESGAIRSWDRLKDQTTKLWNGPGEAVRSSAFSANGDHLTYADQSGGIWLWQRATGRMTKVMNSPDRDVRALAFNFDGSRLAIGASTSILIWNRNEGRAELSLVAHGPVSGLAFSPAGDRLAVPGNDNVIRLYSLTDGNEIRHLAPTVKGLGDTSPVTAVAFSPDGRRLASAGQDQIVKIWEVDHGQELLKLDVTETRVHCLAFAADGQQLAAAGGKLQVWDATRPAE